MAVAGVNSPRTASSSQELPSPRLVSTRFATEADVPSENLTLLVMQWGQFLDHDLTHTPISRGEFTACCCVVRSTATRASAVQPKGGEGGLEAVADSHWPPGTEEDEENVGQTCRCLDLRYNPAPHE
jgi:hypothetical protein